MEPAVMEESQFCAWCLERKSKESVGTNYCIECRNFLCLECADSHLLRKRHTIPPASEITFCNKCSHTHASAFCWDCKLQLCDICAAIHTSTEGHALEHHQWDKTAAYWDIGASHTAVFGIAGTKPWQNEDGHRPKHGHTKQVITSLTYTDHNLLAQSSQYQPSDESSVGLSHHLSYLPLHKPSNPAPAPVTTTGDIYRTSDEFISDTDDVTGDQTYDYIRDRDVYSCNPYSVSRSHGNVNGNIPPLPPRDVYSCNPYPVSRSHGNVNGNIPPLLPRDVYSCNPYPVSRSHGNVNGNIPPLPPRDVYSCNPYPVSRSQGSAHGNIPPLPPRDVYSCNPYPVSRSHGNAHGNIPPLPQRPQTAPATGRKRTSTSGAPQFMTGDVFKNSKQYHAV